MAYCDGTHDRASASARFQSFSLIELLVVVTVIAILAALLLPGMATSKQIAKRTVCLSNHKQLLAAWLNYTGESNWSMPGAYTGGYPCWVNTENMGWNWSNRDAPRSVREQMIAAGTLWPYLREYDVYHCPADVERYSGSTRFRVIRSYSINNALNGNPWPYPADGSGYVCISNFQRIENPDVTFVFGGENDHRGRNQNSWVTYLDRDEWIDWMPAWHIIGVNLSFADGHAMFYRHRDPRTPTITDFWAAQPGNQDLRLMQYFSQHWPTRTSGPVDW